ncbi:hypothetical protein MYCTH_2295817 [Thermothelomyces thermophilus ATCC 42464]|uniref:Uncharacterized protein n=1 Tax=Thermothelomyces thermophilus (strain ATCC 42464 / BCRC 31852 / DSM 1799) TaxID=573729 RepID=G2Q6C7_THET4|nr:uncharacterized protein MYCTH_2295817 [Thermothelomyces thermophilus ATCC 42464]AEO53897.1 hypothetical protein MYCTH_2295817 [Thermothelomyces thermophilus ATCC 42464]
MDILFSHYAVGGLPKSAMAEVERRTQDLLGSSSFQRMLELEKKYKNERARASHPLLPSSQSQPSTGLRSGPPPRPARPASSFPQEQFLMVNATRHSVIPHSLSITIPQAADDQRRNRQSEREVKEVDNESTDSGTPTNSEPSQKQVKFLAPENGGKKEEEDEEEKQEEQEEEEEEDDDDERSEQSSICQSPSWEGYGQRKKDKKLEAERRKREKERAEKEAKAARKRNTARLSKAPPPRPPVATDQESRPFALTAADRSMSDPLLVSRGGQQSAQSLHRPEEVSKMTVTAGDAQQSQRHRPGDNGPPQQQGIRRSVSEGPTVSIQQAVPAVHSQHESRSAHDAFPQSASRTPRLRRTSPSGIRSNSLSQGATSANHSQETLTGTPGAEGARRNGYVLQQRAQAAERAMAGFMDEQLFVKIAQYYPPSGPSSGQSQHARRSSLTQEAKSAALKLVGMKPPSTSARSALGEADPLTFKAIPYSSSIKTSTPTEGVSKSSSGVDSSPRQHDREQPPNSRAAVPRGMTDSAALERPSPSRNSINSHDIPTAGFDLGGHGKTSQNSNDFAAAAMAGSNGQHQPVEGLKPSVPLPPYYRLRALMQSRAEKKTSQAVVKVASESAASAPGAAVSDADRAKSVETRPNESPPASEGSSSSSAFEDGSQSPSPTMTPDTSRPQSAKDVLVSRSERAKESTERPGSRDDERTLRQSLKSSKSSIPRAANSETRRSIQAEKDDLCSRTALLIDTDCDTQSFVTIVSNLDKLDGTEPEPWRNTPRCRAEVQQRVEALKPVSRANNKVRDAEPTISPPPRSAKRSVSSANGPPAASSISSEERREGDGTARGRVRASQDGVSAPRSKDSPRSTGTRHRVKMTEEESDKRRRGAAERHQQDVQPKQKGPRVSEAVSDLRRQMDEDEGWFARGRAQRAEWVPSSVSSTSSAVASAGSVSPDAPTPDYQPPSNPYFADLSEAVKAHPILGDMSASIGPPSPISLPSPLHQVPARPPAQNRADSAPGPSLTSNSTSRASTPSSRPSGGAAAAAPVSILKQPKSAAASDRPAVLSALPKHMQLQAGAAAAAAPIAKIFVECCSCKFYHDMPSKLYECMAKPDAVVEDKLLGISGAITTMVKCPWCQHNMSRACCAGYAAVVYLKEKLH